MKLLETITGTKERTPSCRGTSQTVEAVTFGMVTKGGSEVAVVQSDPGFAITEGAGRDTFLFCVLSAP